MEGGWRSKFFVRGGWAFVTTLSLVIVAEGWAWRVGTTGPATVIEEYLGPICHHIPERTMSAGSLPLPVCARCTGLYGGWLVGVVLGLLPGLLRWLGAPQLMRRLAIALLIIVSLGVVQATLESLRLVSTGNTMRLMLGTPLGLGPAIVIVLTLRLVGGAADGCAHEVAPLEQDG